jgi:hypothetical protein
MKESEMRERLREFHAQDAEERFLASLLRRIEDPLGPRAENGRFRLSPIPLFLAAMLVFSVGVFLFFTFGHL